MILRPLAALAALLGLLLGSPSSAQDDVDAAGDWRPALATPLTGDHGLTGFGSMVDGQIPAPFLAPPRAVGPHDPYLLRYTLRYGYSRRARWIDGQRRNYELTEAAHTLTGWYGLAVQGLDLAVGLPARWERSRFEVTSLPGHVSDRDQGLGAVRLSGKLGFRIPKFVFGDWAIAGVGFYAVGQIDTQGDASGPDQVELGFAVTGPYGYGFRWQGNLALLQREGGVSALVGRAGGSGVPLATEALVVRVFGHLVGTEHEGDGFAPDLDVEGGVQLLIDSWLTIDAAASVRVLETGFVEPPLSRTLDALGDRSRDVHDRGSFQVTFGLGVLL